MYPIHSNFSWFSSKKIHLLDQNNLLSCELTTGMLQVTDSRCNLINFMYVAYIATVHDGLLLLSFSDVVVAVKMYFCYKMYIFSEKNICKKVYFRHIIYSFGDINLYFVT